MQIHLQERLEVLEGNAQGEIHLEELRNSLVADDIQLRWGMGDEVTSLVSFLCIMTMGEDLNGIVWFGGLYPIQDSPIMLVHP